MGGYSLRPAKYPTTPLILRREASIHAVTLFVEHVSDLTPYLAYLFPVLMARGVPMGSLYDPGLELFVHDNDEHDAYKRCVARGMCPYFMFSSRYVVEGRRFSLFSTLLLLNYYRKAALPSYTYNIAGPKAWSFVFGSGTAVCWPHAIAPALFFA